MAYYAVIDDLVTLKNLPILEEGVYCVIPVAEAMKWIPEEAEVLVALTDALLKSFLVQAHKSRWTLSFCAHVGAPHALRGLVMNRSVTKSLSDKKTRLVAMDVLFCNDQLVLNKVVLGLAFSFQPGGHSVNPWHRLKAVWYQFRHLKEYQPQSFRFRTPSCDRTIETAAVGLVATTHVLQSNLSKQLLPEGLINDNMFYAWFVAPKSVMQMLKFFFFEPFAQNVTQPGFINVLRTARLDVSSANPIRYFIDEQTQIDESISLICEPGYIRVRVENESVLVESPSRSKEIRRIQHLPTAREAITSLVSKPLPWITHAATEDFRDLYQQLRENARASSSFIMFMLLSTILACFGLYSDSAPVIIGAMILAPLMAPIVSLAMAFTRQDDDLLRKSGATLLKGVMIAVGSSTVLSLLLPLQVETNEIAARLRPTLLDLGIAIISGIAGAFANARSQAAKNLAGVAIAVALVPPLAVVGIGIGWLSFHIAGGALLLFVTNLVGITLSASVTFLALGYAPFSRARKGIVTALLAVALVSVPLGMSFRQLAEEAAIVSRVEQVKGNELEIRSIKVLNTRGTIRIQLDVVHSGLPDPTKVHQLKSEIESELTVETELEVTWISRY